jgi:hypothetical protein
VKDTPQRREESGAARAKFCPMLQGKFLQHLFTFCSQGKQYFAAVFTPAVSPDIAANREPVHELNRTVMSDLQALGQFSDPWTHISGQPFQRKHELMLLRLKTSHAGSFLTET